jgi:hypothetical protein
MRSLRPVSWFAAACLALTGATVRADPIRITSGTFNAATFGSARITLVSDVFDIAGRLEESRGEGFGHGGRAACRRGAPRKGCADFWSGFSGEPRVKEGSGGKGHPLDFSIPRPEETAPKSLTLNR